MVDAIKPMVHVIKAAIGKNILVATFQTPTSEG